MNLLELVQELAAETGTVSPSDITDVSSPGDEHVEDLVRWIRRANQDIENERDDWRFRIKEGQLDTFKGDEAYDVTQTHSDFQKVLPYRHPWKISYIRVDDAIYPIRYVPYPIWTGDYDRRNERTQQARPIAYTIDNEEKMRLYPIPDKQYRLNFNYVSNPQFMTLTNTCEPRMPARHHRVIVLRALYEYAMSDEAQAQTQRGYRLYKRALMNLRNDQLPRVSVRS